MKIRQGFSLHTIQLIGIFTLAASFAEMSAAQQTPTPKPESVSITLLGTTDLHGRIEPWDYYADKPADLGLIKIATLIKQARAEAPDALLVEIGRAHV